MSVVPGNAECDRVASGARPSELLSELSLDLDRISHVVNFDPPEDDKAYVHRVGRTARAGRRGTGVTLVTAEQQGDVGRLAARLDIGEEFQREGMKMAPPRVVFSGARGGRRSSLRKPARRKF